MEAALTYLSHLGSHQASTPRPDASSHPELHKSFPKKARLFPDPGPLHMLPAQMTLP